MSGLEDGEIESDGTESRQVFESGDFNDECVIDQLVEHGNETIRQTSVTSEVDTKKPTFRQVERQRRKSVEGRRRRSNPRRKNRNSSPINSQSSIPATSTWQNGSRQPRRPPNESVIFGQSSFSNMPPTVDPIDHLKTLISHTRGANYYQEAETRPVFFNPVLPSSSQPVTTSFLPKASPGGAFRGGNYDEVPMEESDDATEQVQTPTVDQSHPLSAMPMPPVPPSVELLAAQRLTLSAKRSSSVSNQTADSVPEDEYILRQLVIASQKRKATETSHSSSEKDEPACSKKSRTRSISTARADPTPTTPPVQPSIAAAREREPVTLLTSTVKTPSVSVAPPTEAPSSVVVTPTHARSSTTESTMEELRERRSALERSYEETKTNIPKLKEEAEEIVRRLHQLQASISDEKKKLQEIAAEKREVQTMIDKKEVEEMEIICDEEQILNFLAPITVTKNSVKKEEPAIIVQEPEAEDSPETQGSVDVSVQENQEKAVDEGDETSELSSNDSHDSSNDMEIVAVSDDTESDDQLQIEDEDLRELDTPQVIPHLIEHRISNERSAGLSAELSLREKLLARCVPSSRQSPEASTLVSSSSEHSEKCRSLLRSMCKFELNGICGRGRECAYHHLHQITDNARQTQILESILRDICLYKEADIDTAIDQIMSCLSHYYDYDKLIQQFLLVTMNQNPALRLNLIKFFAKAR